MATGSRQYGNSNSNFSYFNDNDGMTREFLNTSSATFLASDRLPSNSAHQEPNDAELRHQELVRQMREIENRTLQSTKSSKILLAESEKVGLETAEELVKQREQLNNTELKLSNIEGDLKNTQKSINGIKSVFSSLKTWWNTPKQGAQSDNTKESLPKAESPTEPQNEDRILKNPNLGSAYQKSQTSMTSQRSTNQSGLEFRGFDDEDNSTVENSQDFRTTSKRVNEQLDADLDDLSQSLSRLKCLGVGLGEEIVEQNALIDRIHSKAENVDATISSQNLQIKKILK